MWIVVIIILIAFAVIMGILGRQFEANKKKENTKQNIVELEALTDKIENIKDQIQEVKRNRIEIQNDIDNQNNIAVLEIEFPNHKRILEESVQLIQETGNIDTLLSRYSIALEHYHWIMDQKAKGLPIWFETEDEGFENALNRVVNYHIVRIAMDVFINYKKKMYGLKTTKAKDNNTVQMFEFLEKCKQSLKNHQNINESEVKLNRLHNNTEDFYSKLSIGEI